MAKLSDDPWFEPRRRRDGLTWDTWGHALRDRVPGVLCYSSADAVNWIENRSRKWVQNQSRGVPLASASGETILVTKKLLGQCKLKPALYDDRILRVTEAATHLPPTKTSLNHGTQPLGRRLARG
jgi:hypothetical protein